jgi:hypothetical protein
MYGSMFMMVRRRCNGLLSHWVKKYNRVSNVKGGISRE